MRQFYLKKTLHLTAVLAACAACPEIVEEFESGLEQLTCADMTHRTIRDLLLQHGAAGKADLEGHISNALGPDALEKLTAQRHVAITPCIRNPGDRDITSMTVAEELAKLEAIRGLDAEIADAAEDLTGVADEGLTWRLSEAAKAAERAQRAGQEDKAEYDLADNGARIKRDERSALDALLSNIRYDKSKDPR